MTRTSRRVAIAIAATTTLALSACGSDDAPQVEASGSAARTTGHPPATTTAPHGDAAPDHGASGDAPKDSGDHGAGGADHAAGSGDHQMEMIRLGEATEGDLRIEVAAARDAMEFTVAEGDRMRKHPPAPGDNAHVMVLVSDAESRDRLPDATVTAQITGPGGAAVYHGPLYPMVGMGVGMHYGDNMKLAKSGDYRATVVVGPPRIGRHPDAAERYAKPVKLVVPFTWTAP